jgi:secondary thiamine-phosphate synthase enzyme
MSLLSDEITVESKGHNHVIDITGYIKQFIAQNNIENASVTVFVPGSTASITTVEFEPGLQKDIPEFLEKIAPYSHSYHHHNTWHDDNGSSHIQAALIGPSLTIPCLKGSLTLGTWQQVVLIDSDTRSRERKVILQALF